MKTRWLLMMIGLLFAPACPAQSLPIPPAVRAILEHADRVETFRLADFHEMVRFTAEQHALVEKHENWTLHDHIILRQGKTGSAETARRLEAALEAIPGPRADGLQEMVPSCFDPGVGFRVWRGRAYVDLCVCFYCSGIQIVAKDGGRRLLWNQMKGLGPARAALLTLSREAFPEDSALAAVKSSG